MKLIESSVELLKQEPGMSGINKMIELAGRTCYKSEANITENSAEEFVKRMINSRHMTMLEHGTVYLYLEVNKDNATSKFEYPLSGYTAHYNWRDVVGNIRARYASNKYSRAFSMTDEDGTYKVYITTNLRVIHENKWFDDLQFICEQTKCHEKRIAIKFIPNIAIAREIRTHRNMSFANESTRWCNYSKGKFGNNVTFIRPIWLKTSDYNAMDDIGKTFYKSCEHCEYDYMKLLNGGLKVEDARDVLGLDVKSEIVVTGFASDWREFFDKRLFEKTGKVHPMMLKLATEAKQLLSDANLWDYIMSFPSKFD